MLFVEADEIVPDLWQGSWPGMGNHIKASGFSMLVLTAAEHQEPADCFPGVEVVHAPNYDDGVHKLNRERLAVAVNAARQVAAAVRSGRKVLTTCMAGLNRSGLVNALALHLLHGWPGERCVARVKLFRKPRHGLEALCNDEFVAALKKLGQRTPGGWKETPSGILVPLV